MNFNSFNKLFINKELFLFIIYSFIFISIFIINYLSTSTIKIIGIDENIVSEDSSIYGFIDVTKPVITEYLIKLSKSFNNFDLIHLIVLPVISYFLLIKIYTKFIPLIWATSLALLSLLQSNELPFRSYLLNLMRNNSLNFNYNLDFAITHFPFPSLSVMVFLVLALTTFNINFSSYRDAIFKSSLYTFLWCLLLHIQPMDGLLGVIFFLIISTLRIYSRFKSNYLTLLTTTISLVIIISNIIIIYINSDLNQIIISDSSPISYYYIYFYLLNPILLLLIIYVIFKIDLRELLFKFSNILILIFIELLFIIVNQVTSIEFLNNITENRVTMFFLHFYYYVPFIYYLSRSQLSLNSFISSKKNIFYKNIESILNYSNYLIFAILNFFIILIFFHSYYLIRN